MQKVLITGGAGFIGFNATVYFLKKGFKVKVIDNISRKTSSINFNELKKFKNVINEKGDITNSNFLKKSILKFNPNLIIHCAGQVAVTTSILNPLEDLKSNIIGTFNILEILRQNKLKTKLIHLSTNKVYGSLNYLKTITLKNKYAFKNLKKGVNENHNLDFHTPYGCSKGAAEQYVIDYSRIYGLNTIVLRQSCIYGPNQYGLEDQGWIAWITLCAILGKKINIFGNGKQVRDILHVSDLVSLFYLIYKKKNNKSACYNVGGGVKNSISIIELCNFLKKKKKLKIKLSSVRKGDQKIFISDNSKIQKAFNWKPKISSYEGIEKIYHWLEENKIVFNKFYK